MLIAGPCSAESEIQVMETASRIASFFPAAIFRAGCWKPRTRPGMFEGAGEQALQWLGKVKKQTGMRVATEVAIPRHVELAHKYGIDIFWVGARTTVNPFMVEELAAVMKDLDHPVLVKNPLHPDLQLWRGALERFQQAGINRLAAVHRGFYTYEHSEYRNAPRWELLTEFRSMLPDVPVVCDISHIAGDTALLQTVAQQAADLGVDGFMIETHCDPAHALSDATQQITPLQLKELIGNLKEMHPTFTGQAVNIRMDAIRKRIDELDRALLHTLGDRMSLAHEIAELKREHQVSVLQLQRWKELIEKCMLKADEAGLSRDFVRNIFIQIHDESIRLQMAVLLEKEPATGKM